MEQKIGSPQNGLKRVQKPFMTPQGLVQAFSHCKPIGSGLEEVDVLTSLGLTNRQARVYLALLKTGGGKAKNIASISLVNRQEIYRILDSLQQMGLVQKHISVPTIFTATPITDVIKILLGQKTFELTIVRQKTRQLISKLNSQNLVSADHSERPCLGMVFEGDRGRRYHQAISAACQSIDIITSWKRFKQLIMLLETPMQQALQKGISIRIISEKPSNQALPSWITNPQAFNKNGCLELKILSDLPAAVVSIFDKTTASIAFHPNTSLTKGPDLWTTNLTLLTLSQAYFDIMRTQTN